MSGHKIYGPKGTGLLYIKQGSLISPVQEGGSQEREMRLELIMSRELLDWARPWN